MNKQNYVEQLSRLHYIRQQSLQFELQQVLDEYKITQQSLLQQQQLLTNKKAQKGKYRQHAYANLLKSSKIASDEIDLVYHNFAKFDREFEQLQEEIRNISEELDKVRQQITNLKQQVNRCIIKIEKYAELTKLED